MQLVFDVNIISRFTFHAMHLETHDSPTKQAKTKMTKKKQQNGGLRFMIFQCIELLHDHNIIILCTLYFVAGSPRQRKKRQTVIPFY